MGGNSEGLPPFSLGMGGGGESGRAPPTPRNGRCAKFTQPRQLLVFGLVWCILSNPGQGGGTHPKMLWSGVVFFLRGRWSSKRPLDAPTISGFLGWKKLEKKDRGGGWKSCARGNVPEGTTI